VDCIKVLKHMGMFQLSDDRYNTRISANN